jgi:hypothetical protein
MDALKHLMNISRIIKNLENSIQKEFPVRINYLSRYSNNLIQVSPLTSIDLEPTPKKLQVTVQN